MHVISSMWLGIQRHLFPFLEEELGPLNDFHLAEKTGDGGNLSLDHERFFGGSKGSASMSSRPLQKSQEALPPEAEEMNIRLEARKSFQEWKNLVKQFPPHSQYF